MTIIDINQTLDLIINYKIKFVNEMPNKWVVINRLFDKFRDDLLGKREYQPKKNQTKSNME
jgi:hypothetical protein